MFLQLLEREKQIFLCVFLHVLKASGSNGSKTNSCSFLTKGCGPAQPNLWCGPPKTAATFPVDPQLLLIFENQFYEDKL